MIPANNKHHREAVICRYVRNSQSLISDYHASSAPVLLSRAYCLAPWPVLLSCSTLVRTISTPCSPFVSAPHCLARRSQRRAATRHRLHQLPVGQPGRSTGAVLVLSGVTERECDSLCVNVGRKPNAPVMCPNSSNSLELQPNVSMQPWQVSALKAVLKLPIIYSTHVVRRSCT